MLIKGGKKIKIKKKIVMEAKWGYKPRNDDDGKYTKQKRNRMGKKSMYKPL